MPESAADPTTLDIINAATSMHTLFRHTKREFWGLGIVLERQDDRVKLQFEDGQARSFAQGYYAMLDPVDRPFDVTRNIVSALRSMVGDEDDRGSGPDPVSFAEQVEYFRGLFAEGFADETYAKEHRGDGRKRPLKRHRDALVQMAEPLKRKSMKAMIDAGDFEGVHRVATKVTEVTDLVGAKERKRFANMDAEHHERLAMSLYSLLHGKSRLATRMDGFVRVLHAVLEDESPTWGLASVFLGAVHPSEHVVVRGKVLALQARWMAPGISVSDSPMGILYERLATMAKDVKRELESEGLSPRDMLDATDFMWTTLRPKAQKAILAGRARKPRIQAPEADVQAA